MALRDSMARGCVRLGRRYLRKTWLHRLPMTTRAYTWISGQMDRPSQIEFRGVLLRIDPSDATITPTLLTGQYEEFEIDLLEQLLKPGMTMVDIGANNGTHTCIGARAVGAEGRVLAVEPISQNLDLLRGSVDINQDFARRITIVPAAAGADDTGSVRVFLDEGNSGTHSIGGTGDAWEDVPLRTVDSLVEEHGLAEVNLLKVDVEGYERPVLAGASRLLNRSAPILMMEFDHRMISGLGDSPRELASLITSYGDAYEIDERRRELRPISEAAVAALGNSNLLVVPEVRRDVFAPLLATVAAPSR